MLCCCHSRVVDVIVLPVDIHLLQQGQSPLHGAVLARQMHLGCIKELLKMSVYPIEVRDKVRSSYRETLRSEAVFTLDDFFLTEM